MPTKAEVLDTLPADWNVDLLSDIQALVTQSKRKIVVLDDDPAGTQAVYSVPVLTEWSVEALQSELANENTHAFFVLTNSRGLNNEQAHAQYSLIANNLSLAAKAANCEYVVVCGSDSTLRGHFAEETEALSNTLDTKFDATLLIPASVECGRFTINNTHYFAEGDDFVPASETEFAHDLSFGYKTSDMREWVQEKTAGKVKAAKVAEISVEDIRKGGPEKVAELFGKLKGNRVCVINAASNRDLEVVAKAALMAEAEGKRFLYRCAASFVRARAGLALRPMLTRPDLNLPKKGGGLIVVGSHSLKTTSQLTELRKVEGLAFVEWRVDQLFEEPLYQKELARVVKATNNAMRAERTAVIYTTRDLMTDDEAPEKNLEIAQRISDGLIAVVNGVVARPRFVLAKGGVTGSDLLNKALGVKRAMVRGQLIPGVAVWQLGGECKYPDITFIFFPGNIGTPTTMADMVRGLI
jgi:uncharacterized protein YgbK (DUF1537 family)